MTQRACDIVIATRNRPAVLARSLEGLTRQTRTDFCVIVVDDHSDDPIAPVVDDARFEALDRTVIRLPEQSGPAAARNAGVEACRSEFVIFLDDDVVPDARFVEVHLAAVARSRDDGRPVVSCGPFVEPADWEPTPWNLWEARQAKKEADAMIRGDYAPTWRQFHTGNNCLPIATFRAVGGFDTTFTRSEDDELAWRLHEAGCVFHFEPEAIGWHYSHRTLEAWLAIPRAYARFDVEIDRLHPSARYLASKRRELRRRRLPLRLARLAFRGETRSRWGVNASVAAAKLLWRVGLTDLSVGALSVAYDLSYTSSLRAALAPGAEPARQ